MAGTLLRNTLKYISHIVLIILFLSPAEGNGQSLLLPGDVTVVSVNGSSGSFNLIPLVKLEKGTSLFFSSGNWNQEELRMDGPVLRLTLKSDVPAGTQLPVIPAEGETALLEMEGSLEFNSPSFSLTLFQRIEGLHRLITNLQWGEKNDELRASLEEAFTDTKGRSVYLGPETAYRYHVRNGASGTPSMLNHFVHNASNWIQVKDSRSDFRTSFNLLKPPVVMFEQSQTAVYESADSTVLNVSIYGHDGSRLLVDVYYEAGRSSTGNEDLASADTTRLNFTGLVGDGMYEVKIPVKNDDQYEGTERATFLLGRLSKGSYGDFLSHSLLIYDDELPDVKISGFAAFSRGESGYLTLSNNERIPVRLKGWTIEGNGNEAIIEELLEIPPGGKLYLTDTDSDSVTPPGALASQVKRISLNSGLFGSRSGELSLFDQSGRLVHSVFYNSDRPEDNESGRMQISGISTRSSDFTLSSSGSAETDAAKSADAQQLILEGWKSIPSDPALLSRFSDQLFYKWLEHESKYVPVNELGFSEQNSGSYLVYIDENTTADWQQYLSEQEGNTEGDGSPVLYGKLTATDVNRNGYIDGAEGLSMLTFISGRSYYAGSLVNALRNLYPEIEISDVVYQRMGSQNLTEFRSLKGEDEVQPGKPVWIRVQDATGEELAVSLTDAMLNDQVSQTGSDEKMNTEFSLQLEFTAGNNTGALTLGFGEDLKGESDFRINAFEQLSLAGGISAQIAFRQGDGYFGSLYYPDDLRNNLSLPVVIRTAGMQEEMQIKVSDRENIPSGWIFYLRDTQTDERVRLDAGAKVRFRPDIRESSIQDNEESFRVPGMAEIGQKERYVLEVKSPLAVSEDAESELPATAELHQNFPNPFNPFTTISFYLPEAADIKLSVYNIVGQPVAVLAEGTLSAGDHQYEWDASDMPSSMYIYQLEVGNRIITRKMTLVK